MTNPNAAPTWDWEGDYECPDCGDMFHFMKESGVFPEGAVLQVFHDHSEEYPEGVWTAAAYRTWKGRRRPSIQKDSEEQRKEVYKREQEARKIANASA